MARGAFLCDTTEWHSSEERITKTGAVSTALIESYRDGGKVRHRIIANLHGAELLTVALGRLAAERDYLRRKLEELEPDAVRQFHETVFLDTVGGNRYGRWKCSPAEIDQRYKMAGREIKRIVNIERRLAQIRKRGRDYQAALRGNHGRDSSRGREHEKYLYELESVELGLAFMDGGSVKARAKRMMAAKK